MISLRQSNAINIAEELGEFLAGLGMINWKERLVGVGTDGASVNVGVHGGLGAILKKDTPYLLQVHCVAHRLELVVLDACNKVPYVNKFLDVIKALLRFYSHSSKRLRGLSLASNILDSTLHKYDHWNALDSFKIENYGSSR